jgi:hypothetical protein
MAGLLQEIAFDRPLGRYIGVAVAANEAQASFYESVNPWGPWRTISYQNIAPQTGRGGFANLGVSAGESLGVHIVNAWTSTDGRSIWLAYSSSGAAPNDSKFPPAGSSMDSFNLVRMELQ